MIANAKTSGKAHAVGPIEQQLKRLKPTVARRFKVKRLGLFGSYVQGRMRRSSDIDVLVEFSESVDLLDFVALEKYLTDQIGVRIDLVSKKALRLGFKEAIMNEVVYI